MREDTILIVDDDPTTCRIIQKMLTSNGYMVHCASNGLTALSIINTKHINLIITDLIMPEMNGLDFFQAAKNSIRTAHIPFIIMTEKSVMEDSLRFLGVNEFMSKPFNLKNLLENVRYLLRLEFKRFQSDRALVVGHNKKILTKIAQMLEQKNYYVNICETGTRAISDALHLVPSVILVDIMTTGIVSSELIRALRIFSKIRHAKIFCYHTLHFNDMADTQIRDTFERETAVTALSGIDGTLGRYNEIVFEQYFDEIMTKTLCRAQTPKE